MCTRVWDPVTGQQKGLPMKGHRQWITSLSWEPMHRCVAFNICIILMRLDRNGKCERFASASKDGTVKVWNARTGRQLASLSVRLDFVHGFCDCKY